MRTLPASALALAVGLILVVMGVPRAIDGILMYSGDRTLKRIQAQEGVAVEELESLISSLQTSVSLVDSGRAWTNLGLAQLLLSAKTEDDARARELLEQARTSLRNGLALAPANSFAWTRLAYTESVLFGPTQKVADSLVMSMQTAPYEPRLQFVRLSLSFLAWDYLDHEGRELVKRQIRYAWNQAPKRLVELGRESGRLEELRKVLADSPEDLTRLEALIALGE